jgi:1-acyl-sn-glycerol-3-phosphate acyltransferase
MADAPPPPETPEPSEAGAQATPAAGADGEAPTRAKPARVKRDREAEAPQLFTEAKDRLSKLEQLNIAAVRGTLTSRALDAMMGLGQRTLGAGWVHHCTKNLREVHGLERLPDPSTWTRFILVSNHRSYFDMYVATMTLYRRGLARRMVFPVRSNFFYDSPLGLGVNAVMSWCSMYPPIFRERKKLVLNHTAMTELAWLLAHRDIGIGIHPEGTRNKEADPYTLLPAQSGVGRLIHQSRVPVYPLFINGLINDFPRQILSNFTGGGRRVIIQFGAPVALDDLLAEPGTARTYKAIAERVHADIAALGQEERARRAALDGATSSGA